MSEKKGTNDGKDGRQDSPTAEGDEPLRPFIDTVFDALADWRRREICQFFRDGDVTTATVDELAMLLAGCEPAGIRGEGPATHDDLMAELESTHLPRLDDAGVIDYDDRSNTVRYWGQPTVEKWLEHASAVEQRCQ